VVQCLWLGSGIARLPDGVARACHAEETTRSVEYPTIVIPRNGPSLRSEPALYAATERSVRDELRDEQSRPEQSEWIAAGSVFPA
jgi:hypothetical protein